MDHSVYIASSIGILSYKYDIYEDGGSLYYHVKKPSIWSGSEYHFYDSAGNIELTISKQSIFSSEWNIIKNGQLISTVTKNTFSSSFVSEGIYGTHTAESSNWGKAITISNKERIEVAKISIKIMRSNNRIGMAIIENQDDLFLLGFMMIVEIVKRQERNS